MLYAVMSTAQAWRHYLSRTNDTTYVDGIGSIWNSAALRQSGWMSLFGRLMKQSYEYKVCAVSSPQS